MAKQSKRDTYKYDFVNERSRILHSGITKDPDRREKEHQREIDADGHLRLVGRRTTREAARDWEKTKKNA